MVMPISDQIVAQLYFVKINCQERALFCFVFISISIVFTQTLTLTVTVAVAVVCDTSAVNIDTIRITMLIVTLRSTVNELIFHLLKSIQYQFVSNHISIKCGELMLTL